MSLGWRSMVEGRKISAVAIAAIDERAGRARDLAPVPRARTRC